MSKIQNTGKQFIVTLPGDAIKRMGWKKGTEIYIAKDPARNALYLEEMPKNNQKIKKED